MEPVVDVTDPGNATGAALDRATFVGLAAGAAAGLATTARASAQMVLGKTHPPLVPENDPAIVAKWIEEPPAYAAWPVDAMPETPSLVVIMHIWGVDTTIRDIVRRYAKAGFAAIAPNLFAREHAPSGDGVSDIAVFRPFAAQLQRSQYDGDIRIAADWISAQFPNGKVGITGFCMGATIVLQQTIDNPSLFAAAAPFYGAVKDIDPAKVTIPICGSYGQRDTSIPAAQVLAWKNALHVPNDIVEYPQAGHAFFDDQRASYVPSAAQDAWLRTLSFFTEYLVTQC